MGLVIGVYVWEVSIRVWGIRFEYRDEGLRGTG